MKIGIADDSQKPSNLKPAHWLAQARVNNPSS